MNLSLEIRWLRVEGTNLFMIALKFHVIYGGDERYVVMRVNGK